MTFSTNLGGGVVVTGALAEVTWTQFEDLGDVRRYVPTGTITADSVSLAGCRPLTNVTVPIEATVPGGAGPTLVVYTASNTAFPSSYQFDLAADDTVLTFTCGDDPMVAVPMPASGLFAIVVGGCTGETLPFTDEAHLAGTYRCSALGLDALWDFTQ